MDIASMLQMRSGLVIVERLLHQVISTLASMAAKYRSTPMAGRTHLQHALPITFGYKCGVWLAGLRRHAERLEQIKERCLLVSFGGAAGTLASLGDAGIRVRKRLAAVLGLRDPIITWHVARDGVAEIINYLALVGGSLGKIALDVMFMSSNELNEVSQARRLMCHKSEVTDKMIQVAEPYVPHRGASSTMPQKRNPISSEVILAQSKILRAQAGLVLDGMIADFERASGPWHLEWAAIPTAFISIVGALHQAEFALSGLQVNEDAMLTNLESTRGLIVAESVMMSLANFTGRQEAHEIVYKGCVNAHENGRPLLDSLLEIPVVVKHLSLEQLQRLCNPTKYMGTCQEMVDELLASGELPRANGHTNGQTNGLANGHVNGHDVKLNGNAKRQKLGEANGEDAHTVQRNGHDRMNGVEACKVSVC